uniref:Kinesin motor domain-containing protein n=1 Tax=Chromera velia CCMP2878 TaxID=1169474 RepID=A0A0G4G145_9ALVE|eukprot:Cvel_4014.t1-p1 / transcript=Cvel_4014.t1 / gene=Cvel_4014 / organism=Chromera_velia_CCMP2878 / gene_product=Kinesin-like protein KIF18A, putative / transcript_product=Kinesin-like protein KIF18A, putative / location=Cvel_scaffold170:116077-120439(+) / protein_length=1061 / sequence_SO=supercontig / SO=protein_coding / is_pseudo=false
MSSPSQKNRVHVVVRVRPALEREIVNGAFHSSLACGKRTPSIFITTADQPVIVDEDSKNPPNVDTMRFDFDGCFDQTKTTEDVFKGSCSHAVADVLEGVNATVFAYGQTGTGKTHTVMGDMHKPGIALLAAKELLDAAAANPSIEIEASYLQIYRKHVSDLLSPDKGAVPDLSVKEDASGEINIPGLTVKSVESMKDVLNLLSYGGARRKQASTALNSTSSRSHAILTFHVRTFTGQMEDDTGSEFATEAKLNIVDLAGSERVKDSGVSGEDFTDATKINLSLFHLSRVVDALLSKEKRIPYKDDTLCFVLKDALGGNCLTTLIATVSPAFLHAQESLGTLHFAAACSKIKNNSHINRMAAKRKGRAWNWKAENTNAKKEPERPPVPWKGTSISSLGGRTTITTSMGNLSVLAFGPESPDAPLALCLHGQPSDAEEFTWWLVHALVWAGYRVVALDMPGRGRSLGSKMVNGGNPFKTRSDKALEPKGPADTVVAVVKALGRSKATLIGYDWGGGIALAMASCPKKRSTVEAVVAFHPSYSETPGESELLQVGAPTLILWCKQDQFHQWSKWGPMGTKLKKSLGTKKYKEFTVNEPEWSKHGWSKHSEAFEREIVHFLTGRDPCPIDPKLQARPEAADATTGGKGVVRKDNVVLRDDLQHMDPSLLEEADKEKEGVEGLREILASEKKKGNKQPLSLLVTAASSHPTRQLISKLRLPLLSPESLQMPDRLIEVGLWTREPANWRSMLASKRFSKGRRVLVRLSSVASKKPADKDYLCAPPGNPTAGGGSGSRVTHRAVLVGPLGGDGGGSYEVEVERAGGGTVKIGVPRKDLLELNSPHKLPPMPGKPPGSTLQLEDGIRIDFSSGAARAKMCEIAMALGPLVENLDFSEGEKTVEIQLECVRTIRKCLELTTFQQDDGGRSRDTTRYCKDDAALFASYGQGHCHTVSSVTCSFLLPWSRLLGIDVKYRGGWTFYGDGGSPVEDVPERHQWIEFTLRPSNQSFVCDLYADDSPRCLRDGKMLTMPMSEAYAQEMYPNGKLLVLSGANVTVDTSPEVLANEFA